MCPPWARLLVLRLRPCSKSPSPEHKSEAPAPAVNVEWTKFVDEFIEAYLKQTGGGKQGNSGAAA